MNEYQRLKRQVWARKKWGEPIPQKLSVALRKAQAKYTLSEREQADLDRLNGVWRCASTSTARNRHIAFLAEVLRVAGKWEASPRQYRIKRIVERTHGISTDSGSIAGLLLKIPPWGLIDRRIRHRWRCILRLCRTFEVSPAELPALVRNLGGINAAARRWQEVRGLDPRRSLCGQRNSATCKY